MTIYAKTLCALPIAAVLGSGLVAGTFFIFSVAIMPAFARLPANEGISSMQTINLVIVNPIFLGVFLGTALLCIALVILSVFDWRNAGSGFLLTGSILYLSGILITFGLNIPMNNTLANMSPLDADAHTYWAKYLSDWTFWNHVRGVTSLLASTAFIWALRG